MASTQPARGMRDFLPEDVRRRNYVVGVIREVYERYGFEPLETPAVENIETLLGKYGEEGNKLIFKILKRGEHEATGEADLALSYDLTVPLARVVAEHQATLPKFFKRYQVQPVWRADRPARGRFREFYQCDVDTIGSTSPVVEVEILAAVSEILTRLGFHDYKIRINHRELLTAMLNAAGVAAALHGDALVAIDKLDKIGRDGVRAELIARGLSETAASACMTAFEEGAKLDRQVGHDSVGVRALDNLRLISQLSENTPAAGRIVTDPSLARGLSYYTGAIMEVAVSDLAGSLGGGGRYDNLIGMFLGRDIPACGFSLGLERILVVMSERNMFPETLVGAAADVMVTLWDEAGAAQSLKLAGELRHAGLRVDVYPEPANRKIGKQFKYAGDRDIPFAAVLGDEELTNNTVGIKDLRSQQQETVPRNAAADYIKRRLETAIRGGPEGPPYDRRG